MIVMILGILEAGSVPDQLQPDFGDYPSMIRALLTGASGASGVGGESGVDGVDGTTLEFRTYKVAAGIYPQQLDECQAYLITGSAMSVYDPEPWIRQLEDYVVELHQNRKKTVGICFGHQMIARALGGKVEAAACGWGVGVKASRFYTAAPIMISQLKSCHLLVSHRDQVTQLPEAAALLAGSDYCPHAIFRVDDHFLCLQGHPEFKKGYSRALMEMRRGILGEVKFSEGIDSLAKQTNEQEVAQWILSFLYE